MNTSQNNNCNFRVYVDSSFGNGNQRRSIYGYVIFINGNVVHWKSKVSPMVSLSSTEAEFVAMAMTLKDIKWISTIISELFLNISSTIVFCDNQGALRIFKAESSTARTRHLDIKLQFLKTLAHNENYELRFVQTQDNVADCFTKGLNRLNFKKLIGKLMEEVLVT